jgi:hypothetical protein
MLFRYFAAVIAVFALSPVLNGAVEEPQSERLNRLITDLGSEEYTVRETATEELSRVGLAAYAALEAAATHPDREVRYRSQRVLGIIRRHDTERRLEAFLSGQETSNEYPLPGWSRFRKAYGDGGEQRRLFVEMQRIEAELMRAMEENPRRAAEVLTQKVLQSRNSPRAATQPPSIGQVTASLFVAADAEVSLPDEALAALFGQCFQVRDLIDGGRRGEIPRKMLGQIVSRCEGTAAFQAMGVAQQFKLPEGIEPATKILRSHDGIRTAPLTHHALITIAKLGNASHLPLVDSDKLMTDETQVAQFKENETTYVIQLRDVALATAVVLAKQDLKSFFEVPPKQALDDPQMIFLNARLIGFPNNEKRSAVFTKWEKYKSTLPRTP